VNIDARFTSGERFAGDFQQDATVFRSRYFQVFIDLPARIS